MHPSSLLNAMSAFGTSQRSVNEGIDPVELKRSWDMYDRWHWSPQEYLDSLRQKEIGLGRGPNRKWSDSAVKRWENNFIATPQFIEKIWPHEQEKHRQGIPSHYQVEPSFPRPE